VQNVSSNTLWINFNTDANEDQPSMQLLANGGSFVMEASAIVTDSVSIIGGTVAQSYTAKEASATAATSERKDAIICRLL